MVPSYLSYYRFVHCCCMSRRRVFIIEMKCVNITHPLCSHLQFVWKYVTNARLEWGDFSPHVTWYYTCTSTYYILVLLIPRLLLLQLLLLLTNFTIHPTSSSFSLEKSITGLINFSWNSLIYFWHPSLAYWLYNNTGIHFLVH